MKLWNYEIQDYKIKITKLQKIKKLQNYKNI